MGESPGSRAPWLAHLGTAGPGRARGGGQCLCPGDSAVAGWGGWGTSSALPVPTLLWWSAWRWRLRRNKPFWVPLPTPHPGKGGGWVGVGRPGPAGPVRPGAPVVWGACHFEKAGSSGAGTAVGGRMPRCLQTHKYRHLTGGRRRARVRAAGAPRVSRGPGGSPLPQLPTSWLTVLARLGSSPTPAGPPGAGE